MSTKSSKRSSRKSVDSDMEFKIPEAKEEEPQKNGSQSDGEDLKGFVESEINSVKDKEEITEPEFESEKIVTRGRSATPQIKRAEENGEVQEIKVNGLSTVENGEKNEVESDKNGVEIDKISQESEMEPLILEPDEPEPELQFDENSDLESGKDSPIISRSMTRRSQLRNIPTPKTPKSISTEPTDTEKELDQSLTPVSDAKDAEKDGMEETKESVNSSFSEITSTKVEVENDTTRNNFVYYDLSQPEITSPFLNFTREKSVTQSLRLLTSRRSIHSIEGNAFKRSDLNVPYPRRESVEPITGIKRKKRSETPEESKRAKYNSYNIFSYITSPVYSLKTRLSGGIASSTPKLTGFKNTGSFEVKSVDREVTAPPEARKWCSIM